MTYECLNSFKPDYLKDILARQPDISYSQPRTRMRQIYDGIKYRGGIMLTYFSVKHFEGHCNLKVVFCIGIYDVG